VPDPCPPGSSSLVPTSPDAAVEPADLGSRLVALVVDGILVVVLALPVALVVATGEDPATGGVAIPLLWFVYRAVTDATGGSLGKRLLRLKVVGARVRPSRSGRRRDPQPVGAQRPVAGGGAPGGGQRHRGRGQRGDRDLDRPRPGRARLARPHRGHGRPAPRVSEVDRRALRAALLETEPWLGEPDRGPRSVDAGACDRCRELPRLLPTCGPSGWEALCRTCALAVGLDAWCDGHRDDGREALRWAVALPRTGTSRSSCGGSPPGSCGPPSCGRCTARRRCPPPVRALLPVEE
jgi:hypothetical protein